MKKLFSLLFVFLILSLSSCACEHEYESKITKEASYEQEGEITYTCKKCGNVYTETIEKKHTVPDNVILKSISDCKYRNSIFSISVYELISKGMANYNIQVFRGEEAISNGYVKQQEIDKSIDLDRFYYAVISGDAMSNPQFPYVTNHENRAIEVFMIFDENDNLLNSGVSKLCKNLQSCALLIMTKSY